MQAEPASWEGTKGEGVQWTAPPEWLRAQGTKDLAKRFAAWSSAAMKLGCMRETKSGLLAEAGESEEDFRTRVAAASGAAREAAVAAVRARHASRLATSATKVTKANAKLQKETAQANAANVDTVATWGGALLGAMFGRGSAVSKITSAARTTNRNMAQAGDVSTAKAALEAMRAAHTALEAACDDEVARCEATYNPAALVLEHFEVAPRKADTQVLGLGVLWRDGA